MRQTARLLAAGLLSTGTAVAQPPPTQFAADRGPPPATILRVQASTLPPPVPAASGPPPDAPKGGSPSKDAAGPTRGAVDALFGPTYPIDLPTALRLANVASPTIAIAQVRVREALARVDEADALRVPTLSGGGIYTRHDGITQRQDGTLLTVSRQSFFAGGGLALRVDLGEAYFQPLV